MNLSRVISSFSILLMMFTGAAYSGDEKLANKLSKGNIIVSAEVKGCHSDAMQLCPGLPVGSQKSLMCLLAYEDKLSNPCKLGIVEAALALRLGAAALDYSIRACEADADKYCLDVQPGEGRILSCLKKNEAKVNKNCIAALKQSGFLNSAPE